MTTEEIIKKHKQYLKENQDSERAEKEKAYLYSDLHHYGLPSAKMGSFFREYKKQLTDLLKKDALKIVQDLWKLGTHEERMFALNILNLHKESLEPKDKKLLEKLMRESRGWAFLDNLIIPIMPTLLKKYPETYEWLTSWIKDDDYWVRRSALLAQLLMFRKNEKCNKKMFFEMSENQLDETWIDLKYSTSLDRSRAKFFIRKAIGWALREMSQTDADSVVKFLNKNKKKMSGLSYREGSRKLDQSYKRRLT